MAEYGLKYSLMVAINRARRGEKFLTLLLLFILLTATTAGVSAVLTGPDWASLWESLLFGLLLGWALAIFRWPAWRSVLLVIGLGMIFCLLFAAGLDTKVLAVFKELFRLTGRIIPMLKTGDFDLTPLTNLILQVFTSTEVVLERVFSWLKALVAGQPAFDLVATGIVWSIVVWLVAAWAGWVVEAGRNALAAVLPALLLNLSTLSYGRSNSASIYLILGTTLMLIAIVQYGKREQEWNDSKVAYPLHKSRQMGNISLIIAILLVVLAAFISSLSLQRLINLTSDIRRTSDQTESDLARSLGIIPAASSPPDAFTPIRNPGLPRELLIGSGPQLSAEVVMSVEVQELASLLHAGHLPPLYWRSFTFDNYTGHGWSSSPTKQTLYQPNEQIHSAHLADHELIQAVVRPVPGWGGTIYSAGEPVSLNVPSSTAWRSSNDLFGVLTESNSYEVQALIPVVDEVSLRETGQVYPAWILQRYLALPDGIPARVKELSIQLTAAEPTPYDRVRAIEGYLRDYPYTLDVPHPPSNQDLVDFFLFDLGEGYCDYYASAMVVLTRAAGIPSRLAIGYASGEYNLNSKRFIVTQADAHSWVEVYFPDIGWVPFEPTAGLPSINRSMQPSLEATPTPITPAELPRVAISNVGKYIGLAILVLAVGIGLIWIIYDEFHFNYLQPQPAASDVYRRLRRYGEQLGTPLEGGETPYEFTASLSTSIAKITRRGFAEGTGATTITETQSIIRRIVRLSYRPADATAASAAAMIRQWKSLRWRLRLMWVAKIWEAVRHFFREGLSGRSERHPAQVE